MLFFIVKPSLKFVSCRQRSGVDRRDNAVDLALKLQTSDKGKTVRLGNVSDLLTLKNQLHRVLIIRIVGLGNKVEIRARRSDVFRLSEVLYDYNLARVDGSEAHGNDEKRERARET